MLYFLLVIYGKDLVVALKLIILQSDPLEASNTAHQFKRLGCDIAATGSDGKAAASLVQQLQPDALLLDPYLIGRNCDEIVEELSGTYTRPLVTIMISRSRNDRMANRFLDSGGDFFLLSPLDYEFSIGRIERTMIQHQQQTKHAANPIRRCVRKYLVLMAMPPLLKGTDYIYDGVEILLQHPEYRRKLTVSLYPAIAERNDANGSSVERCIRTALECVFTEGNIDFLYEHFEHIIRPDTGKPRPGDFIAVLSDLVKRDLNL